MQSLILKENLDISDKSNSYFPSWDWLNHLIMSNHFGPLMQYLLQLRFVFPQAAREWFLDHMATDEWWSIQILIKCPNQIVRQMFQRLCIHVVQKLRCETK